MSPATCVALLVSFTLWGSALAQHPWHWGVLATVVVLCWRFLASRQRWRASVAGCILLLLLLSGVRAALAGQPSPSSQDPVHHLAAAGQVQVLEGEWQHDVVPLQGKCRGLLDVQRLGDIPVRGATEVLIGDCARDMKAGERIRARGRLRRPPEASHPLLPSPAQRLARQGCWSQFQVVDLEVLSRSWTPLADARRHIQTCFREVLGPEHGGMLSALVLGGVQVELPESLRQSFRVAGLSHALAASGFHLSVLLGSVLLLARGAPAALRVLLGGSALLLFLAMAGAQASVVRAVLMGSAALLIREGGGRSRPFGVLLATLVLMLWLQPSWANDVGFQFSVAATAGLVVTAPAVELRLQSLFPRRLHGVAAALAVPFAAMAWTLPLQWIHFGAMPLYALLANLLASPLLSVLTLVAMGMAVLVLVLPPVLQSLVLPLLAVPARFLAGLLHHLVTLISSWPMAQLFTGRPKIWMVLVLVAAVVACCTAAGRRLRLPWVMVPMALLAFGLHGAFLLSDAFVRVEQWGRQWVLLRHRGRAALLSSSGDALSCRVAQRLGQGYGHARFDWVVVLDPVATEHHACWTSSARTVLAEQLGQPPLRFGQWVASPGLVVVPMDRQGRRFELQAGHRRIRLQRERLSLRL